MNPPIDVTDSFPPPTANDSELLAYLQQRDEKRRHNIAIAITVAIVVVIAGFGIHSVLEGKRAEDQFNDKLVCQYSGFSDC